MQFLQRLREPIRRGDITVSIRIWQKPRVRVGGRYKMDDGEVVIDSLRLISLEDVTPALARESGFDGLIDLLKTAKHGSGRNIYLVHFHFEATE